MDDALRPLWDFDDLDATAARFETLFDDESADEARAEILTQLARVDGLRGVFEAGEERLAEAVALGPTSDAARARIDLERGRLRRSSGDGEGARPLFESAFVHATSGGLDFIAADAAHMAALAAPDDAAFERWTTTGIELAESREAAAYWLGPLLNNVGWHYFENDRLDAALDAFERALQAREREPGNPTAVEIARFCVAKTLRALGRAEEAIPILEQAVAWAEAAGAPDGWFHEELAEEYAAVGRSEEAAEQARLALSLLEDADPSSSEDIDRSSRLRALADAAAS